MNYYLKIITPLFTFIAVYSFLSLFFGPKGLSAAQQLTKQRDFLVKHVHSLSETGDALAIKIANLSSDPETIAVYAHELGYVHKNERLIKLLHFSGTTKHTEDAGSPYTVKQPHFLSDTLCKTAALLTAVLVMLGELFFGHIYAYKKSKF